MSETVHPNPAAYVILTKPTDPTSIFTTDVGGGHIAACVFSQMHQALQFGKNAQGLAGINITSLDLESLHRALEARMHAGVTHIVFDPSAGSGTAQAVAIAEFIATFKVGLDPIRTAY